MKRARWMVVAVAALSFALAGCSDEKSSSTGGGGGGSAAVDQSTPEAVTLVVVKALSTMDIEGVSVVVEPDYAKAVKAQGEAAKLGMAKIEALAAAVETLDKEGGSMLRMMSGMAAEAGKQYAGLIKDGKLDTAKVKIQTTGDTATVTMEGDSKPQTLVKLGGKWYVKSPEADKKPAEAQAEADKALADAQTKAKVIDELIAKIKSGKITKENVKEQVGKAMGMGS